MRASSVLAQRNGDIAVIDTGMAHHGASLIAALAANGIAPQDVTLVFNTHAHVDHSHNNALFPTALIYCSALDRSWTRALHAALDRVSTPGPEDAMPFYPAVEAGVPSAKVVRKMLALDKLLWDERRWRHDDRTVWIEDVDPPNGIRVLQTPGHAPHHVSFVVETAGLPVLICGDALLHRDDLSVPTPQMLLWDTTAYQKSLDTIRSFSGIIIPGHDEPFTNVPR